VAPRSLCVHGTIDFRLPFSPRELGHDQLRKSVIVVVLQKLEQRRVLYALDRDGGPFTVVIWHPHFPTGPPPRALALFLKYE
jgi:hypothetical protein